jgi:hypothetical protein
VKLLHVIPSLDLTEGGPSVAVPLLARAVAGVGFKVTILATRRDYESPTVVGYPLSVISGCSVNRYLKPVRRRIAQRSEWHYHQRL